MIELGIKHPGWGYKIPEAEGDLILGHMEAMPYYKTTKRCKALQLHINMRAGQLGGMQRKQKARLLNSVKLTTKTKQARLCKLTVNKRA